MKCWTRTYKNKLSYYYYYRIDSYMESKYSLLYAYITSNYGNTKQQQTIINKMLCIKNYIRKYIIRNSIYCVILL